MSVSVPVILDPSISLPDGKPSTGPFRHWSFGIFFFRYKIDAEGRLWEEPVSDDDEPSGEDATLIPLHGFLTFEVADRSYHRYTARFTYGRLDGIKVGEAGAWNEEHS